LVLPLIEGDTFACNDNLTHKVPAQTASLTGYSGAGYCIWSAGGTDIGYEVNGSPVAYNIGIFTVGWMDDGGVCKWGIGFIADDCDNLYGTWEKLEGDTPYGIYTLVSGVGYMPATLEVTA
jgi:hypothetical protein